jgi:hypothetical protein
MSFTTTHAATPKSYEWQDSPKSRQVRVELFEPAKWKEDPSKESEEWDKMFEALTLSLSDGQE